MTTQTQKEQEAKTALMEFDDARCAFDLLKSEIETAKQAAIPAEVRRTLMEIDEEFESVMKLAEDTLAKKKAIAKSAIEATEKTVKIPGIATGSYVKGSISVSAPMKEEFLKRLETHPGWKKYFRFGNGYARIK